MVSKVTRVALLGALCWAIFVGAACKARLRTPSDFAKLKEPGYGFKYRAISPDEVTIALKRRKNEPRGDVEFWVKVLKEKVPLIYGYTYLRDEDITTDRGVKGKLIEFEVTQEDGKYMYLIGIFIKKGRWQKKRLWIVEAGGKEGAYKSRRKDIIEAIKGMRI